MNSKHRLGALKTQAALLFKDLHAPDRDRSLKAAQRFLSLPFLRHNTAGHILNDLSFFRLKHAYAVIAAEEGHKSWEALRETVIGEDCLYVPRCACFLSVWFARYEEAERYHRQYGGYLIPLRRDFAVCGQEYIRGTSLGDFRKEWRAIGYNWVKPQCNDSWRKLYGLARANYLSQI